MTIRDTFRKTLRAVTRHRATRRPSLCVTRLEDRVNPAPIQFFYVPMPEAQVNAAFDAIVTNTTISATQESVTVLTVTEDGTTVWYDQWEDGYEAVLGTPRQASTRVWGDGDDANGIAPGFAADPAGLPSGTVLKLRNTVNVPRNLSTQPLLYDSPDKFGADKTLAVSRAQFPTTYLDPNTNTQQGGSVISSAVEVRDTRYYDTGFTAPVGVNTPNATRGGENSMFSYTAFFVQAFLDATRVRIDANADGDFLDAVDTDTVLAQGQTVVSSAGVLQGARVVASKPVQADLLTGQIGGQYASRTYALFSDAQATNDYFTPVGFGNDDDNPSSNADDGPSGDNSNQDDVRLYVFNPNTFDIRVRRETTAGTDPFVLVPARTGVTFTVTTNSGTRLFAVDAAGNPTQDKFLALGVHDGPGGTTAATHDWGFSLQPKAALSQVAIVGLGIGNSNSPPSGGSGAGNFSPVYVTALVPGGQPNTTLYVDHNNDGTVDETLTVTRLQSVRLRDTTTDVNAGTAGVQQDFDNSGLRVYTTDGTLISVAWGEDGTAPDGSPGLDAGTTVPAVPVPEYYKFSTFAPGGDVYGDGFFNEGDTVRYSLRVRHIGTTPISNAVVTDALPTGQVTYLPGSTVVTSATGAGTTVTPLADDGAGTAFPLDDLGYTIVNLDPNQTVTVQFDVVINTGLPAGFNFILNQSVLAYDIFRLPANDVIDLRGTVGDRVWYDIDGDGAQGAGEPGIAGATVTLTWLGTDGLPGGDDQTFTATTGSNGAWSLTNLPAGEYTAAVANPHGLTVRTAGPTSFTLPPGQVTRTDLDFGYRGGGRVGDFVWADTNANGLQDAGEPGLAGATVTLTWAGFDGAFGTGDDITYPAATTTGGPANYGFADLPAGNFQAAITPPTGGAVSPRDAGVNDTIDNDFDPTTGRTLTITLAAGATNVDVDTGVRMSADLRVTKTDGVTSAVPGTSVTYTITVSNAGPADVVGAALVDTIPAALTGVTWTSAVNGTAAVTAGAAGSGNALAATVDLPAGAGNSVVFTVTGTVSAAATGSLTNTATVAAPPGIFDPTLGNNSATDTDTLTPQADLVVTKTDGGATAVPGGLVTYTITVTNNGPSVSGAITLTDAVPADTTFDTATAGGAESGGVVTWALASLAPNASTQVTVTFRVAATVAAGVTDLSNTATATGTATDPVPGNNSGGDTTPLTAAPDLRVTKTDPGTSAVPGGLVTYTITVFNDGDQGATGVTLTETVPANTAFVAAGSDAAWDPTGTTLGVGALAAGASRSFTYQVRVNAPFPAGTSQITNTVDVTDDGTNGPDPTPLNNRATRSTPVAGGRIADRVFLDADGNGVQDAGELSVPGVTVRLLDGTTSAVLDTQVTDGAGTYRFVNLAGGAYRVSFGNTDGTRTFAFSAPARGGDPAADSDPAADGLTPVITLAAAELRDDIDAGVYVPVTIGDTVFYDADGNGTQGGEPGIPGVTVALYSAGPDGAFDPDDLAAPSRTTVTGAGGSYAFAGLAPGNYRVAVEAAQAALAAVGLTSPTTAATQPTTLASGGTDLARDFGFRGTGSLGDRVWLDRNADGAQGADEPGLPGLTVTVTWLGFDGVAGGDDVPYPAVPTGANGAYAVTTLPTGTFVVTVDAAGTNLVPTFDPDGGPADGTAAVVLTGGAPSTTAADFGLRGTTSVGDLVFQDIDRDGVLDAGELGLPGVAVTVRWAGGDGALDTADDATFTMTTGATGAYTFTGLPVYGATDPYRVTVAPPAGYTATGDLDGVATTNAAALALGPTDARADADFALGGAAGQSLAGSVYHDLNGDGDRDPGEPGLSGVAVRLSGTDGFGRVTVNPATGQPFFDAATIGDGSFLFDSLVPGTYTLAEPVQPAAYGDGLDAAGTLNGTAGNDVVTGIVLAAGAAGTGYTFGELGATISGTVFRDDDRDGARGGTEPGVAGVVLVIQDTAGNPVTDPATGLPFTAATGPGGAYSFANVPAGSYRIVEAQPPGYADGPVGPATVRAVALTPAGLANQDFAEVLARVAGTVYVDRNANARLDAGEPGIGGVTVALAGTDQFGAAVSLTTQTAADGTYAFDNLFPADAAGYTVTEGPVPTLNDGGPNVPGTAGGAAAGPNRFTGVAPAAGQQANGYNFAEVGVAVGGTVFVDLDRDGSRGPADPPLANVVVELLDAGGAVVATAVTGPDGAYLFTNVLPGTYTVREAQPAGYGDPAAGPAAPNARAVTVATAPVGGLDFGDTLGSLAGVVYLDANRSGGRDAGEPGLGGVVVTLTGTDAAGAAVTRTTTTAADGGYRFDGLLAGTYTLTETQPTSVADGADAAGSVNAVSLGIVGNDVVSGIALAAGADYAGQVFGEEPPPAPTLGTTFVAGTVYRDANTNGALDGGETGLAGVTVELRGAGGAVLQTAVTRADGTYLFLNVAPGTYAVAEPTQPAGLGSTTPDVLTVTVPAGPAPVVNVNFGEAAATVGGRAYLDLNGSGAPDAGEPGLGGVLVTLTGTDTGGQPVTRTAATAADGTFRFTDLPPGTYTVTEMQPTGLPDGADLAGSHGAAGNDVVAGVTLAAGAAATGIAFGELPAAGSGLAFVTGTVFIDADRDGTQDPGEAPVPGVTVELLGPDGTTVVATTQTGPDGRYAFPDLPAGTYFVREVQPAGLASTSPNLLPVSIDPARPAAAVSFGEVSGSVAGSVYQDLNGDGVRGPGEVGIGGAIVTLTGPNGLTLTATTDADGNYRFDGLADGTYVLTETQPAGYADGRDAAGNAGGTPAGDTITGITLAGGAAAAGYTFGELGTNSVSGVVYADNNMNGVFDPAAGDTGYRPGILILLTGTDAGGNLITRPTRTAADGSYGFAALPAGTYRVVEDQPNLPTTATPPDGVYDGADNPGAPGGAVAAKNQLVVTLTGDGARPPQAAADFNFGELPPADPFGFAFEDRNGNGRFDAGEPGLAGVTVTISGTAFAGTPAARPLVPADLPNGMTVTTDAVGRYEFNPVPPGLYAITLTTGPGGGLTLFRLENADPTAPAPAVGATAFTGVVQNPLPLRGPFNFGFVRPVSLAGAVYLDANNNGARDAGDPGVGGVTVRLTGADGLGAAVDHTTVTAADGTYSFAGLLPGVYDVTETQPADLFQGFNTPGTAGGAVTGTNVIGRVTLTSGTAAADYLFGERPVAPLAAALPPPLDPPAESPADVSKRMFLSSTPDAVVVPATGRTVPDFAALGSVSTARNPEFFATAAGPGGDLVRVFDLTGGTERFRFRPFPGNPGGVRVAVADLTGDGVPDIAAAAGPGGGPRVAVYDGNTGGVLYDFLAFEAAFSGGLFVAAGDIDRDGRADLVVTPDVGGGPRARVLSAGDPARVIADIWAIDDPAFRGGVRPAVGDVDGDGAADLVITAGAGGGPRVAVWSGATLAAAPTRLVADFFAFEPGLRDGAYLAVGDVDGDGRAELIAGAGPGGAPRVVTFAAADLLAGRRVPAASLMVGDAADRGGVPVAAVDVDGDGRAEVLTGAGARSFPRVRFTDPRTGAALDEFAAEYMAFQGGVFVG